MKMKFDKQVLIDLVGPIASIIPKKPYLPSQACVQLTVKDRALTCSANNGEVFISKSIDVTLEEDIEILIDGKMLKYAIDKLTTDVVVITILKNQAKISDKKSNFKIPIVSDMLFESVPHNDMTGSVPLSLSEFMRAHVATKFSDPSSMRPIFCGVCVHRSPSGMNFYASDGPTAYRFTTPYGSEQDFGQVFVPNMFFTTVHSLIDSDDDDRFHFAIANRQTSMMFKGFYVTSINIQVGRAAPVWENFFKPGKPALLNPDIISQLIGNVQIFCDDAGLIRLTIGDGKAVVSSLNNENENSEGISEEVIDTDISINEVFNYKLMLKVLKSAVSNFVDISEGEGSTRAIYMVDRKANVSSLIIPLAI